MKNALPPLPTGSVDVSALHAALDQGVSPAEAMKSATFVKGQAPEPAPADPPASKADTPAESGEPIQTKAAKA